MIDNNSINLIMNVTLIIAVFYLMILNTRNKKRIQKIETLLKDGDSLTIEASRHVNELGTIVNNIQKEMILEQQNQPSQIHTEVPEPIRHTQDKTAADQFSQILMLNKQGMSNDDIATSLSVSPAEVKLLLKMNSM